MAIAQLERDPAMLERIETYVGPGLHIVADPDQVTREHFEIFGAYVVARGGTLKRFVPGTKEARPRLDQVLGALADVAGVDPLPVDEVDGVLVARVPGADSDHGHGAGASGWTVADVAAGRLAPRDIVTARWMWSHDVVRPGDDFKLAVLPTILDGFHVYAPGGELTIPFSIALELPEGIEWSGAVGYPPADTVQHDELLQADIPVYDGDIPLGAFNLRAASDLPPGPLTLKVILRWQACDETSCLAPTTRTLELPLRVVPADRERGQVYGWEGW